MWTAAALASDVRDGRRTALGVVEEALDRIAGANAAVNAFCEVRPDAARAAASALDARLAAGEPPGPLAGVPVGVKDVIWERGVEATAGSRALLGFVPDESAAVVERLEAAGAIVVGRTNIPEFCYRGISSNLIYGTTGNPWDPATTPGGSSGGSGAAIAAGLAPLALGGDGGGSIRIPASFCGVVGLKPTYGLVPREPQWPGWVGLTHIGPMAATVLDVALMLAVLAGPDDRDPLSLPPVAADYAAAAREPGDLRGLRIAYSEDLGYIRIDDGVRARFRETIERFRALGAELEEAHPGLGSPVESWNVLACVDNLASEGGLLTTGHVDPATVELITAGGDSTGLGYARARNAQLAYAAAWGRFMRRYDLMLTPAMECTSFRHGLWHPEEIGGEPIGEFFDDWCHFCYPFNFTGQPAISVPMGTAERGLPVGLQIVGRRFEDELVLRAAAAWERLEPWPLHAQLPQAGPRAADGELGPLAEADEREVTLTSDAKIHAGERLATPTGVVEVERAASPAAGQVTVRTGAPRAA
jgi:Asp-tRNA(Asn)/Glu-tRNA(Gln) amidotransferase A subunit family amidase